MSMQRKVIINEGMGNIIIGVNLVKTKIEKKAYLLCHLL